MTSRPRAPRAFTLIELLIVVAIIAILAAIAVPNFLEAQTRSKVSRVKNDHRTIATGMEAYCVDWNTYPRDSDNTPVFPQDGFLQLTTPIAYMTSLAVDPFADLTAIGAPGSVAYYEMGSGIDNDPGAGTLFNPDRRRKAYMMYSVGADRNDDTDGNDEWPFNCDNEMYDPTNGSISNGDIYRFGGDWRSGTWTFYGVSWQSWSVSEVVPK